MATDVFAGIVRVLSEAGRELATTLGDRSGRESLMLRAGRPVPAGAPPSSQATADALEALRARAEAGSQAGSVDTLLLLRDLADAMVTVVSYIEQAAEADGEEDAWNLFATWLDIVALDRFREDYPEWVALMHALHLISDDRLLIADLIRAGDQWGSFVLGRPDTDDAAADNWSLILGAALAVLGYFVPIEDDQARTFNTDFLFGWDPDPSTEHPQATRVLQRMASVRLKLRSENFEEHAGISAVVVPPSDGGWGLFFVLDLGAGVTFPVGKHLEFLLEGDLPSAIRVFTGSDLVPGFGEASGTGANARIALRRKQEVAEKWVIGADDSVHLEVARFLLAAELGEPSRLRLNVGDAALVMPREAMGFLGSVLPSEGAEFGFDLDLAIDSRGKLAFAGGAGMTVTVPVNKPILVLTIRSVTMALAVEGGDEGGAGTLSATVAFGINFGKALSVTVDQIGAKLVWTLPSSPEDGDAPVVRGNLGPAGDLGLEFVAPRGIGIAFHLGPVKGGGFLFLDQAHHTYGGALEASLKLCDTGIQIKAAGLLRETDDGWSFVGIISAQFEPAAEIFLGMTLNGVGGLVGVNVAISIDALRTGLHDGAVGRLLFPDDPVANAPAIVETLGAVFPPREGGTVAGPMLQIGWGRPKSYMTLSVAVVLASPSPALLAILGRLRVAAPDPEVALVDIKADFVGLISFEEPSVSFDASLVDSRVAEFTITGDMALRAGAPGFILSVGGFHPRFTPPANVPALRRITLDISPNAITKIKAEAYLAVTSNTFQVGLHAALDVDAGAASVHGWLDFDALVQWDPRFRFSIEMKIGLELRVGGRTMAGVSVELLLEGPGPWHAKGSASIHLFFFTIHAGFEVTWGELDAGETPPEVNAPAQVAQALSEEGAWKAVAPSGDALVTFRDVQREQIGVHPYGQLTARQQLVPLGVPVTRVGRSRVAGGTATVLVAPIAGAPAATPTTGQFAASQFQDLSDDERLSRPSFEPFQDGVAFGAAQTVVSAEQMSTASYETIFIPDERRHVGKFDLSLLRHALDFGAIARSGLHRATLHAGADQRVRVSDAAFRVVAADTLAASATAPQAFGSAAAAFAAAGAAPERVVVVEEHEALD
jgi:hypothetical protein